jgi:hypothetical protein
VGKSRIFGRIWGILLIYIYMTLHQNPSYFPIFFTVQSSPLYRIKTSKARAPRPARAKWKKGYIWAKNVLSYSGKKLIADLDRPHAAIRKNLLSDTEKIIPWPTQQQPPPSLVLQLSGTLSRYCLCTRAYCTLSFRMLLYEKISRWTNLWLHTV